MNQDSSPKTTYTMAAKIALVTGASSGIGRAAAIALSKAGWTVVLSGRRLDALEDTLKMMGESEGGKAIVVPGDLSMSEDIKRLFEVVKKEFGGPFSLTVLRVMGSRFVLMGGYRTAGLALQRSSSLLETGTPGLINVAFRTQA
jgi:NAD(P)-dependent dehydrogenase (short-subunit alcohol dehydrogenase family)